MQPKQFRIPTYAIKQMTKKGLYTLLPILIIAVVGGLFIAHNMQDGPENDYTTLMITVPMVAVYLAFGAYSGMKRQKAMFSTYVLTFHSNSIEREQKGTPTIHLYYSEIKQILMLNDGSFHVRARDGASSFMVPASIEQYEEVKRLLQEIMPIERNVPYSLLYKYIWAPAIATIGLMVLVFLSSSKLLVSICGAALISLMVWALIVGRKNKSIDQKTKRGLWWILILLLSIAGRIMVLWLE